VGQFWHFKADKYVPNSVGSMQRSHLQMNRPAISIGIIRRSVPCIRSFSLYETEMMEFFLIRVFVLVVSNWIPLKPLFWDAVGTQWAFG